MKLLIVFITTLLIGIYGFVWAGTSWGAVQRDVKAQNMILANLTQLHLILAAEMRMMTAALSNDDTHLTQLDGFEEDIIARIKLLSRLFSAHQSDEAQLDLTSSWEKHDEMINEFKSKIAIIRNSKRNAIRIIRTYIEKNNYVVTENVMNLIWSIGISENISDKDFAATEYGEQELPELLMRHLKVMSEGLESINTLKFIVAEDVLHESVSNMIAQTEAELVILQKSSDGIFLAFFTSSMVLFVAVAGLTAKILIMLRQIRAANTTLEARIRKRTRHLHLATKRAEMASRQKSEFIANMSHEIRTPLNAILGMAQVLKSTEINEVQRGHVEKIYRSGSTLLTVLTNILDTSKLAAGKMVNNPIWFSLDDLIFSIEDVSSALACSKEIDFCVDVQGVPDKDVFCDYDKLQQILLNLCGNAVKFTEEGAVVLLVEYLSDGVLLFEVQDSGPGIPRDQVKSVFNEFHQVDSGLTRKHGGTGLGLTISKQLAELLGGQIGVESVEGVGSCFWIRVPVKLEEKRANPVSAAQKGFSRAFIEKREFIRQACTLFADIYFDDVRLGVAVEDLSENGAKIVLDVDAQLPESFMLHFATGIEVPARLAWQDERIGGIEFTETISCKDILREEAGTVIESVAA